MDEFGGRHEEDGGVVEGGNVKIARLQDFKIAKKTQGENFWVLVWLLQSCNLAVFPPSLSPCTLRTMPQPKTLVIIPCYNEAENIVQLVDRLMDLYPSIEVLVVDDSSPDGTAALVKKAQERHAGRLHLIVRQGKGGRGSAVLAGFAWALERDYEIVFEMDSDFSHKPEEIASFMEKIKNNDMVVGSRYLPGSEIREWGPKRTFFSKWANRYARLVLRIPMSDYTNGFRAYRRKALEMIDMKKIDAKGYVVLSEVAYQLHRKGATIGEVPTVFVNRRRGISNLTGHEIHEAFFSVIRIRSPHLYLHMKQVLKFIVSGGLGAAVDLGSLPLLIRVLGVNPYVAPYVSSLLGALVVFLLNKYFTFRNADRNVMGQLVKFAIVYGPAIFLNGVITNVLFHWGLHYLPAKVIAIGVMIPVNYFFSHSFVFRKKR